MRDATEADGDGNVFESMSNEADATDIAAAVFENAGDGYFAMVAEHVFADVLVLIHRETQGDDYQPTNDDVRQYIQRVDVDALRDELDGHELSASKHLAEDSEAATDIMSTLLAQVETALDNHDTMTMSEDTPTPMAQTNPYRMEVKEAVAGDVRIDYTIEGDEDQANRLWKAIRSELQALEDEHGEDEQ